MVRIDLVTNVAAPIERCFDLSRSIDLHMASTDWTGEQAIGGVTSGLIGPDQTVTWQGRHFGLKIRHTSRITAFDRPGIFRTAWSEALSSRSATITISTAPRTKLT
jgi:hypothetical protein